MRYKVRFDPKYHVLLEPSEQGDRWAKAHKKAIRCLERLRAEGIGDDWQLALCAFVLGKTSERTYAADLAHYQAELERASRAQPDPTISPEALSDGVFPRLLYALGSGGSDFISDCLKNNGRTDAPPQNVTVVWGLRSTYTGRWLSNVDVQGVESLNIFRTRELAQRYQSSGNEVVWMYPAQWWRKVLDAAKTGYPRNVLFLEDVADERTVELVFRIEDIVTAGPETFIAELAR